MPIIESAASKLLPSSKIAHDTEPAPGFISSMLEQHLVLRISNKDLLSSSGDVMVNGVYLFKGDDMTLTRTASGA